MKKIIGLLIISMLAIAACEPTNHPGPPRPDRAEDGSLPPAEESLPSEDAALPSAQE